MPSPKPPRGPRFFWTRAPRIVEYQLRRLSNTRLLEVERNTDDPKYTPVYQAILSRSGMSPDEQSKAAQALATLNKSTFVQELLASLNDLNATSRQDQLTATQVIGLMLRHPSTAKESPALLAAIDSPSPWSQRAGFAGLFSLGRVEAALAAAKTEQQTQSWLAAVEFVPDPASRNLLRQSALDLLNSDSLDIRRAAIACLRVIPAGQRQTYPMLAKIIDDQGVQAVVVRTLLAIGAEHRDTSTSIRLVDYLVKLAESTPAEARTSADFSNAMQLADRLLSDLPIQSAKAYRARLRETTVRVIQVKTIEEEMRYDRPYFVVEAGRPVQVVLQNDDLMGHNLVITTHGSLKEVAELGLAAGPAGDSQGRQYVPNSEKVLFATDLVGPGQEERLTFNAPTETGEYPYVCTFPRHWMRMYGVMVVVDDLDAWLQNPMPPADPLGIQRAFVNNWRIEDFADESEQLDPSWQDSASPEKGAVHFVEATCSQCHQANGNGGLVGPAINGVLGRWQGNPAHVLREILEPSHRIDLKYAVHLIVTFDGDSLAGIVAAEDKTSVSILANPESKELTTVARDDIEEMVRTSTSMMPKGLLDRYGREEVLDLLAYVISLPDVPAADENPQ